MISNSEHTYNVKSNLLEGDNPSKSGEDRLKIGIFR